LGRSAKKKERKKERKKLWHKFKRPFGIKCSCRFFFKCPISYISKVEHVQMNWIILHIFNRIIRDKFVTVNKVILSPLLYIGFNMRKLVLN
jgi:hypothetical protein